MKLPLPGLRRPKRPPLWVMMHIPKTAGASLAEATITSLGPDRAIRLEWFDTLVRHSKISGLKGKKLVISHIAGRELGYLSDEFDLTTFTVLRDPVARVVSNFTFWRETQGGVTVPDADGTPVPLTDPALDWQTDLARALKLSDTVWKFRDLADTATWQLATSIYERGGRDGAGALTAAKARLSDMAIVGFQDRLDETYARLMTAFRVPDPAPLPRHNATAAKSEPDAALRDLIIGKNQRDLELTDWARSRFG